MKIVKLNLLLIVVLLFVIQPVFSQINVNEKTIVKKLSNSKALSHGQWSLYAEYSKTGKKIFSYNSRTSLAPASGLKLFTTSAALSLMGENFKFETKLYYDGSIDDSVLNGNIYIVGGGDPTLGSNLVKSSLPLDELMASWVSAIKKTGIKKINGAVAADDFLFDRQGVPDFWAWVDIGNYYGAGSNALSINDNLYYLYFKPAKNAGGNAVVLRTEPEIPGLTFTNYMKTGEAGSGDNGYIYCAPQQFNAVLRGTIPAGVSEFAIKGSVPNPPLFAAQYFEKFLKKNGIIVSKAAYLLQSSIKYDKNKLITITYSPPLKDIVYIINKKSFNLYAEQILKMMAVVKYGFGNTKKGIEAIKNFFTSSGLPTGGFELFDGSGLSRTNRITSFMMTKLLSFMTSQKVFNSFYNSLAIAGDTDGLGFFKRFGKGTLIEKNARVKSGLITKVRSLSGYIKDKKGRMISFSFIANNFDGTTAEIDRLHKQLLLYLAGLK